MTDTIDSELRHDGAAAPPPPEAVYAGLDDCRRTRDRTLTDAAAALDDAIGMIEDALERGAVLNLTECARRAGVSKATIYNRLSDGLIGARQ